MHDDDDDDDDEISVCVQTLMKKKSIFKKTDPIEANFSNNAIYFNALFVLIVSNVLYSLHHLPVSYMLYYTGKAPPPPLLPPISYKNPYFLCN
ncbi:hypothetical protein T02_7785 [Trichinella nativa]|uniref:Uncharacterized protein n=1 Tax=Trichinella nativa TaxID=6335 RepID=A0A0V1LI29_9BILA|nr:hypothetical protein T02_7785 [Trichinella nativa]